MKILYIGEVATRRCYERGIVPSHWLYGAVEMERGGHEVVWEQESPDIGNDLRLLRRYRPDAIFIPNLNLSCHKVLLALKASGTVRTPIYAYLHHGRPCRHGVGSKLTRMLLSGVDHLFFLSDKSMEETCAGGYVDRRRCSNPGWGPDTDFYGTIPVTDGESFVSTGKEHRDFDTLIEAFRITGAPLTIMTARLHAGSDYTAIADKCRGISNIEVRLMDNTGDNYPAMLQAMAAAKALVCPLDNASLSYCVGLSTVADAEGLRKPLIATQNPYHDIERMRQFAQVSTIDDWVTAIQAVQIAVPTISPQTSIRECYERMMEKMIVN